MWHLSRWGGGLLLSLATASSPGAACAQTVAATPPVSAASTESGTPPVEASFELWPELDLYTQANPTIRFYFAAAEAKGKESRDRTVDVAGYVDLTIGPRLPLARQGEDWQTKKYVWVRVGYDHVFKAEGRTRAAIEERGIFALHGRHYLPWKVLVEGRARVDLRWIDGDYSTRYRYRMEVNRDFEAFDRVVTPYLQAEFFYDTRYDHWSRHLYQLGAEIALTRHFRVEPSVARQLDQYPSKSGLGAFALVARWYY